MTLSAEPRRTQVRSPSFSFNLTLAFYFFSMTPTSKGHEGGSDEPFCSSACPH